jgi:hypothetical protein
MFYAVLALIGIFALIGFFSAAIGMVADLP